MNENLNLVEILKDCPKGTKLYSTVLGEVNFMGIKENATYPIIVKINDENFEIIDTAGINRKSKLSDAIDHYALNRAFNSLEESNLTLLVIDATKELSHFDARIAGYAMEFNKPIILVINK